MELNQPPQNLVPANRIEVVAIDGLPEVSPGASLAELLLRAATSTGLAFHDRDVLVVAQKIISKAEGRLVELSSVEPSPFASSLAARMGRDARQIEVVLRESKRIVRMDASLIVSETHHGLVCANAGVDTSNVPSGWACLLPVAPDASARRLQSELAQATGKQLAVIVSDTFGRPWREGLTNVAIGIAGFHPLLDYRGQEDAAGHSLTATVIAAADEMAAAAELVMGKLSRRPAAIIRNFAWQPEEASSAAMIRPRDKDLFR
jgi:coenzyme F420-0:L-glutamate ligase/coenzyme F420-1:gamma-L-glutamate ligase